MRNPSVKVIPFPEIENAYLIISCYRRDDDPNFIRATMSFFYDNKTCGTEWEPQYGPIQIWYPCDEKHEDKQEHYYYPFVVKHFGDWSQMAVDYEELREAFLRGDFKWIFSVLKRWSENR